jgi:hypothetical protein
MSTPATLSLVLVGTVEARHATGPERRYTITNGALDNLPAGTYHLFASTIAEPQAAADAQAAEPVARVDNRGVLVPTQHGVKTLHPGQPLYTNPALPSTEPVEARRVTLTARQILAALEFAAPDFATDDDQLETNVVIAWGEEGSTFDDEGNPDPAGYRAWLADYPEEGAIPLDDPAPEAAGEPQTKEAV